MSLHGFAPPPPRAPYVDRDTGNLILSRYQDVLRAFREPRLWPAGSRGEDQGGGPRNDAGIPLRREHVQDALSASRVAAWQAAIVQVAMDTLRHLPTDRPVDLLREFAFPWCLRLGRMVMGVGADDAERLGKLAALAWPDTGWRRRLFVGRRRIDAATAELDRYFASSPLPMGRQTFVGTVQTLPRLLASGWLALFRDAGVVTRLREDPTLMPRAVEELLRYAGIIPRLYRRATADVDLGDVHLKTDGRVTLMIASANRDPSQFPGPDRLDLERTTAGQLSLGIGGGSCAGARVVRMAFTVSIAALLGGASHIEVGKSPRWRSGHFQWPLAVPVTLRR